MSVKENWIAYIHQLQDNICAALEAADGQAKFFEDAWEREEGGGGKTRVMANGDVFEKGGVNTSVVFGDVTDAMKTQLKINGAKWFACGLSLVIHPVNPFVPTVHCNYRMFELYNEQEEVIDRWFGGGTDLTPYYLVEEDAIHFHQTYKNACDRFDVSFYPKFKADCDNYFVNWHRNKERRGIGGIFYDYQRADENRNVDFWMNFGKACGNAFIEAYIPIVQKRKGTAYTDANKHWQEIRRGRYVEFNLVHDRGTLFGLKTNGRIESILMSLPPTVRFEYNYTPGVGSEEYKMQEVCLHPRNWLGEITDDERNAWAKRSNTC
ncbi:MAG TPA: oxygen-dependent coproporphyrinogen oxidase [Ferruginibacter sp.]|nr:oxygen-dependent coproporphyrinogen oxidase [Ferruginibacter sp.]HMP22453.1 oxygen-dependent coproporphyrinogen oxidase [Ferruginibacter sp.]